MVEQPKANAIAPLDTGNGNVNLNYNHQNRMNCDDEFFHLTCHIVRNINKIEKGDFVELEKLLLKERNDSSDDGRVDLIHKDSQTFF